VRQLSLIQVKAFGVLRPLRRLSVNDEHAWDLGQLRENDLVVVLHSAHNSILQKVAVPFVVLY